MSPPFSIVFLMVIMGDRKAMSEWVTVYQAANNLEAHTIKGALEVSGIKVQLKGEALAGALGELPANAIEVTLLVRSYDI
ncbi:putative signal transducing protein [Oceanisphaera ostreae]|uniref:Signal transducing protein n=1 Tax=Oceanisphaera ostreae TaxID=914151 RepID=A0ABW3KHT3_9GAMM